MKRLRLLARPWLAVVVAAIATSCARLRAGEDELMAVVEAAARGSVAADSVWPGYSLLQRGFIVFDPGRTALLVATERPPPPWRPIASSHPSLHDRVFRRDGGLPGLTGGISTDHSVGTARYPAVEYDGTVRSTLSTVYHEAFHAWQDEFFTAFVPEVVPADATTSEQIAGAELERRILAAALRARGASADSLIATFLAARQARMASLDDSARALERSLERHEGTAHLTGFQAARAALGLELERVENVIVATLEQDLSDYGPTAITQYRWRAYGTGAAIGLLLDRLGAGWRGAVAGGAALDSLLGLASRIEPAHAHYLSARVRFGYDELLAEAREEFPLVDPNADPVADFLARAPYRLILEIETDGSYDESLSHDPGDAGIEHPVRGVTLIHEPERASLASREYDLSSAGRPIMMDGRDPQRIRLTVLLPRPARVDGGAPVDARGPLPGTLRVTGEDTEVEVRGSHVIALDAEADALTIRIRAH